MHIYCCLNFTKMNVFSRILNIINSYQELSGTKIGMHFNCFTIKYYISNFNNKNIEVTFLLKS